MFPPKYFQHYRKLSLGRYTATFLLSYLVTCSAYAGEPGALISNQATLQFIKANGQARTLDSNVVTVVTGVLPSTASIELTRVVAPGSATQLETLGPSACLQAGAFTTLPDPLLIGGTPIDPTAAQSSSTSASFNLGEPVFIRLLDADQNADFAVIDVAIVQVTSGGNTDSETVRLTETGVNTGVFTGYLPTATGPAVAGDCVLQGIMNSIVTVTYVDPIDSTDTAEASALLDPVKRVFESRTGALVSNTAIELVDATTGLPAVVFGNDGVSQFPSRIISGGSTTDSSGTNYNFGPGEYRFPVVPDGDYRLEVTPLANFAAPSQASIENLQQLPGGPFALGPGSFGDVFTKSAGLSFAIDIPLDPLSNSLFLQKRTVTNSAAPGDFVRYELILENAASGGAANSVIIVDQLPAGMRFVPGTATSNGVTLPDPALDLGQSTLTFEVGDLSAAGSLRIFYVVEIISGKPNQELINSATAFAAGGLVSNKSDVSIRLTEDLFRSGSTLIGRVVEGDCSATAYAEDQGVADVRIYLEDGRYAVSDEGGRFHFEGLRPGSHVAQLDTESVPEYFDIVGCDSAMAFAGSGDSQYVRLNRGALTRADFYLRRKRAPVGQVDIELQNVATDSNERVAYVLQLSGEGNVGISNVSAMLLLPSGVSFLPGSMTVDGKTVPDPRLVGPSVTISLPDQQGRWSHDIHFIAAIAGDVAGELLTRAFATFDSPMIAAQKTPVVETKMLRETAIAENEGYVFNLNFAVLSADLSKADQRELGKLIKDWSGVRNIRIQAIGHSDSDSIAAANRYRFADNYVLSAARARAAANFVARALNVAAENVQVEGRGPNDPLASNASADGRRQNRRVEMILSGERPARPSFISVTKASSGTQISATKGAIPGLEEERRKAELRAAEQESLLDFGRQLEPQIGTLRAGIEILLPAEDYLPALPVTRISIKHGVSQTVQVSLNGKPVSALNFDGMVTNVERTFAISRWAGVDLEDGSNRIRVLVKNADGSIADTQLRTIIYTGAPIRAEIVTDRSVLIADGKTRPVIAVRLFDSSGQKTRMGSAGTFRISSPYRSWWEVEDSRKNKIVEIGNREPLFRVLDDGVALIELEPTTMSGEAVLTLNYQNNRQQEIRVWLSAAQREWILVGFAEGTVGYNTLNDNKVAALSAGHEDGYYDDGRVAFFAKGSVKGEYLLTLAYDSRRNRDESRSQFQTVIDPNANYPLYADKSEQRFEAASQRKLYIKLEKRQFVALFGDFNSGLSYTELARYERRMNGFLSEYRGENVGFTVFASETDQSFVRDDIRGDGTSGLYRLSSAPLIANSDQLRVEVRDRFDTGTVLSTTVLTRFLDYSIDPLEGTVYFKKPVPSRDQNFNPIFIVAEYESFADANEDIVAGGRVSLQSAEQAFELGITHINDGQQGSEADLSGLDLRWQVNDATQFRAEIARSNREEQGLERSGTAYTASLNHQSERIDVRAYVKEVEDAFGLGLQSAAETGIRKVGIDGRAKIGEHYYFDGEATWQQNLATETIRSTARGRLRYENNGFTAVSGIVHATDDFDDGETVTSDLVEIGLSQQMGEITVRATGSFALSNATDIVDFPTTMVLGADYKILPGVDLFAEFEDASGRDIDARMSRLGVRASPWHRGQINSSVTNESSELGTRLFSNLGLVQGFKLNDNWVLDLGMDSTKTLVDPGARIFDEDRERVAGSVNEDFAAYFAGATYNSALWSANARLEIRNADSQDRLALIAGWYREPALGHSMSAGLTLLDSRADSGEESRSVTLKYGWAWRKADSRWSFLNRIDLIFEELRLSAQSQDNSRFINNFNANRRISAGSQLALQYAFKYVRSSFDAAKISGYTDLVGVDFRRGFSPRWDAGVHTSVYHSYKSRLIDYGFGLDVGFKLRDNLWLTLGYNLAGFYDSDFSEARYTAQGPFLRITIKADQHSLKKISGRR